MVKPERRCENTSEHDMLKKAIDKVLTKKFSLGMSSEVYNVPKSTLFGYIKKLRQGGEIKLLLKKGRFKPTFTEEYEEALIAHVVDMSNRSMPLTRKEFMKFAFDLAEKLKLNHRFNMAKKSAGKRFCYDFIKRHPHLNLQIKSKRAMGRRQKVEKNEILTSSHYQSALVENNATNTKPRVAKEEKLEDKKTNDLSKIKRTKKSTATPKETASQTLVSTPVTEETTSLICKEDNDEDWVYCPTCNEWIHKAYVDIKEGSDIYNCDICRL